MQVTTESLGGCETCTGSGPRAGEMEECTFCKGHDWRGRDVDPMVNTEGRVGKDEGKEREDEDEEHGWRR